MAGDGALEKLTIGYTDGKKRKREVEALFNPTEIGISRSVAYEQKRIAGKGELDALEQEFLSVEAATLSIELFFDTYEARSDSVSWSRLAASAVPGNPFATGDASDVRKLTRRVAELARPDRELHEPPVCHLRWGRFDVFEGVLTSLEERFTMFLEDGTPARATLSCTFVESRTEAQARTRELHSADVAKTRVVRRDDTLQSLAAEEYGDPSLWRAIATANGIVNPRHLAPGTVLTIPKLGG